ncbi:flagellar motor stator protein MotA [Paenibacillus segetis]|uniref:Flagellar motor protein MotA n=1 Tax=Paenibacillus segetis TaxID=1325360 RepID=A0ABQ1YY06_9BACL|nr:flagellar motor stator protein MotA [Paenibacillus segetis]GGH40579.1 flagellar motor protein MotA [Paenibacillus segetis]
MEISTIIGLVLGVVALIVGMFLKGAPVNSLIENPAAFVIIFGGTAATLFVAFPMSELKKFPKLIKLTMTKPKMISKGELIKLFMEWATITRREGLLALESKVDEIDDDFLRGGMRMIIDGNDQDFVQDVLTEDIAATEERHKAGAMIFSQAGMYAPTLGVLGAVIGLIAALSDMSNVDILSHAISGAFIATVFGIFTGYVMWHPIATKLKRMSKREMEIRLMMVEGLLSIQSGVSTIAIQQKLAVFLTPAERAQILEKGAGEGEQKV